MKQVLIGLGVALATAIAPHGAAADEAVSVRLKWVAQAQFAGLYVALAKGFYGENGLDVTINPGGPNINAATLVASGADTFGVVSGTEGMLNARAENLPLVAIAMSQQATPYAYVTYDDSGIESIQDFAGRSVATWFTGTQYTLFSVLAHEGVAQDAVQIVSQPFSMQPFIDRQYDVATVTLYNELNVLRAAGIDNIRLFRPDDSGVTTQQDAIVTSESVIAERPETVQAFLDATLKGWKYAFENKSEAVDIVMAAGSGLERTHQELMLDEIEALMVAGQAASEGLGYIDMDSIQAVQQSLLDFDALAEPVDLEAAFDSSFWNNVPDSDKRP